MEQPVKRSRSNSPQLRDIPSNNSEEIERAVANLSTVQLKHLLMEAASKDATVSQATLDTAESKRRAEIPEDFRECKIAASKKFTEHTNKLEVPDPDTLPSRSAYC